MSEFVLGLDLDGVTGDYVEEFRLRTSRATGYPIHDLGEPSSWSFAESWEPVRDADHYLDLHIEGVRDGMFRSMPVMDGAVESLWRLSDADVHIRVITHRFISKGLHHTTASDTVAWLDRHNIPYRDLCFVSRKAQVDADIYIDDAPHNVENLRNAGKDVIIFDAPYNRAIPGKRARSWAEASALVLEAKAEWDAKR